MNVESIRIFIGAAPNHADAECQAVLEYSLRKHTSMPLEITWMILDGDPASPFYCAPNGDGWHPQAWATPFSGFRWAVPELAGHTGRAIYMDSDVIAMADVAELWRQPFPAGAVVLAKPGSWRLCVSLWDCKAAGAVLPKLAGLRAAGAHSAMSHRFGRGSKLVGGFEGDWNCLDGEPYDALDDKRIKAIHYTSMPHQPHLKRARKRLAEVGRPHWFNGRTAPHWRPDLVELFDGLLVEAEAAGYPVSNYTAGPVLGHYPKKSLAHLNGSVLPAHARRRAA